MTPEKNIGVALLASAKRNREKIAFVAQDGNLSYAGLERFINGMATLMLRHGVGRGSCVAIEVGDPRAVIIAIAASSLLGAAWTDGDRRSIGLVGEHVTHTLYETLPPPGTPTYGAPIAYDPRILGANIATEPVTPVGFASDREMSRIGLSSGSTGRQKAIWIPLDAEWDRVTWEYSAVKGLENISTFCLFPPKSGVGSNTRIGTLLSGGTVLTRLLPDRLASGKVDQVVGSPAQFAELLRTIDKMGVATQFPLALIGGGRPSAELMAHLRKRFKQITVFYGSTELGNIAEYDGAADPDYDGRLKLSAGYHIEIVDDQERPLPFGEVGAIRMRSDALMPRYFNEDAQKMAFRDGWFYSGDRGSMTSDGLFYVIGRTDDTANLGGVKVDLLSYDDFIQSLPDFMDGYSFVRPDEMGIDRLNVIVRLKPGLNPQDAAARLLQKIRDEKQLTMVPTAVYVSDQIPRTETGKPAKQIASNLVKTMVPAAVPVRNRPPTASLH